MTLKLHAKLDLLTKQVSYWKRLQFASSVETGSEGLLAESLTAEPGAKQSVTTSFLGNMMKKTKKAGLLGTLLASNKDPSSSSSTTTSVAAARQASVEAMRSVVQTTSSLAIESIRSNLDWLTRLSERALQAVMGNPNYNPKSPELTQALRRNTGEQEDEEVLDDDDISGLFSVSSVGSSVDAHSSVSHAKSRGDKKVAPLPEAAKHMSSYLSSLLNQQQLSSHAHENKAHVLTESILRDSLSEGNDLGMMVNSHF